MKKYFLYVLFLLFLVPSAVAQEDVPLPKSLKRYTPRKEEKKLNLFVGGYFGFQLGTYTFLEVAPHVGIYPIEYIGIGIGGTYMFMRDGYYDYNTHVFGFSAFVEGYPWKGLTLHVEYEYLNYNLAIFDPNTALITERRRVGTNGFLLGGGYRQKVSDKVKIYALILFNLAQDKYSFNSNPVFRLGVDVDL